MIEAGLSALAFVVTFLILRSLLTEFAYEKDMSDAAYYSLIIGSSAASAGLVYVMLISTANGPYAQFIPNALL